MTKKIIEKKVKTFIEVNGISFEGGTSCVNSSCVIICGYYLYLDDNSSANELFKILNGILYIGDNLEEELCRVYKYAYENDYGEYWKHEEARKTYTF